MNINSTIQIKNRHAVISTQDVAALLGRKHLSVLRALDAIPAEYLREGMFFMLDDEVFVSAQGVLMLHMSRRHLHVRRKIMIALFNADDVYQAEVWDEFYAAMPPKAIVKLCLWLVSIGANSLSFLVFRIAFWFSGYTPRTN